MTKKPFSKIIVVIIIIMSAFQPANAKNVEVGEKMSNNLKQYRWYNDVRDYVKREQTYYIDYNIRHLVVQYLEMKGIEKYQAENTHLCNDEDYNKDLNTCYHGTAKQNFAFHKALQSKKIQDHLSKTSAYSIINGINDEFLDQKKEQLNSECSEYLEDISKEDLKNLEINDGDYYVCISIKNDITVRDHLPR